MTTLNKRHIGHRGYPYLEYIIYITAAKLYIDLMVNLILNHHMALCVCVCVCVCVSVNVCTCMLVKEYCRGIYSCSPAVSSPIGNLATSCSKGYIGYRLRCHGRC